MYVYTPMASMLMGALAVLQPNPAGTMDVLVPLSLIGLSTWALTIHLNQSLMVGITVLLVATLAMPPVHTSFGRHAVRIAQGAVPTALIAAVWFAWPGYGWAPIAFLATIGAKRLLWDQVWG